MNGQTEGTSAPAIAPPAPVAATPATSVASVTPGVVADPSAVVVPVDGAVVVETPTELALTFGEGIQVNPEALESFKALAKESGLKAETAQKIADLHSKILTAAAQKKSADDDAKLAAWTKEITEDKDIGGPNFEASRKTAMRAIEKFGSQALKEILNESGYGSHPELVRFAYRVGKALAEDSITGSTGSGGGQSSDDAILKERYPSMFPKE